MPENDQPTASMDRAERRDHARGYREQQWGGQTQYVCMREPCYLGPGLSRANTFDEAEMQAHQQMAHAGA